MLLGAPPTIQRDLVHPDVQPTTEEAYIGIDGPEPLVRPELSAPNGCGDQAGG
jgi:hypothetical protein